MSSSDESRELLAGRDSGGFEWEDVSVPFTPKEHEHLIPPKHSPRGQPKQLCGYLNKLTKGPLKTWRSRWFVFDDQRCYLYYYNNKAEFTPQGMIDVSNSTLTYQVENLPKNQFEICTPGRMYYLQASSREAMFFWLEALQKKRRKFSARRKKLLTTNSDRTHQGLIGESDSSVSSEVDDIPYEVPEGVENREIEGDNKLGVVSSTRNLSIRQRISSLSQKFKVPTASGSSPGAQRKSNFFVEPPILEAREPSDGVPSDQEGSDYHPVKAPNRGGFPSKRNFATDLWRRYLSPSDAAPCPCPRCADMQDSVARLEYELKMKEREVKDRDEINEFLRNEIRMTDMKAKVREELMDGSEPNSKKVDVLLQREQTIDQLQRLLEDAIGEKDRAIGEKDRAITELEAKKRELATLGEQVVLFKEAVSVKDQVVVQLTNKLFQLENNGQILTDPQDAMLPPTTQALEVELEKMKEAVEAYKRQNQFLSSEILELNSLRAEDLEAYRVLSNKHSELEAQHCRIQSKFMILLQESQEPRMGSEVGPNPDLVSQMIEEAVSVEDRPKDRSLSFDGYGFSQTYTAIDIPPAAESPLRVKAKRLDQQAQRFDETASSQKARWDNYFANCGREMQRCEELKLLIRNGVPSSHRSKVWKWCITYHLGSQLVRFMCSFPSFKVLNRKPLVANIIPRFQHSFLWHAVYRLREIVEV